MEDLKGLSDEDLSARLRASGITHGPIVASTRPLYEKKLQDALRPGHRSPATGHRSPAGIREPLSEDGGQDDGYSRKRDTTHSSPTQSSARHRREGEPRRTEPRGTEAIGGLGPGDRQVPVWLQLLLFAVVSGLLFYFYQWMESDRESPGRSIGADSE